jgi:hypothetical protein
VVRVKAKEVKKLALPEKNKKKPDDGLFAG